MVSRYNVVDTKSVALLTPVYHIDEPNKELTFLSSRSGIYLGKSMIKMHPVFLDFGLLINPHIFICGITGGGKSYLMKTLLLKINYVLNASLVVIDFTGEYGEFSEQAMHLDFEKKDAKENSFFYLNFSHLKNENEKIHGAKIALDSVANYMRSCKTDSKIKLFVMLDEAWKLITNSEGLESIIREGRKYGVGLIFSSQVIEDFDRKILSNVSTVFAFRMQNRKSVELLSKNYNLSEEKIKDIQNLEVGSCMLIRLYKWHASDSFIIKRIEGLQSLPIIKLKLNDGDAMEIKYSEFERFIENISKTSGFSLNDIENLKENDSLVLDDLIKKLIAKGIDRRFILRELRKFGLNDLTIADCFASAIEKIDEHE